MVALVDAAGTILAANGAFAVRAAGPDGEGAPVEGSAVRRPSRRLGRRPVPLRRRGQGGAAAADRPGPGRRRRPARSRSSCCSTTFPARAATTRTPMSTPCSTACRSASLWPTPTAASSSSTRCSARAVGLGAERAPGLARRPRRRRGQGGGLRRGPPLRPRPADVGRPRRAAQDQSRGAGGADRRRRPRPRQCRGAARASRTIARRRG